MNNKILENAKKHFLSQINGEMQSVEVKEWDCTIYWKPINGLQRDRILKYAFENKMTEAAYEAVILRSLNEEGKRIFSDADKASMMRNTDPKVVDFIFGEMGGVDDEIMPEVEDAKKS